MKRILLILLLFFFIKNSDAQDVQLSQNAETPLLLNPANTGLINGSWRTSVNYRNQWTDGIRDPFVLSSFSADLPVWRGKSARNSIGLGLIGFYSELGGSFATYNVGLSAAYHQQINKRDDRPSILSIGTQAMQVNKFVDEVFFYSSNEKVISRLDPYFDYNVGVMLTGYFGNKISAYGGFSFNHITQPVEQYYRDYFKIRERISVQAGGAYQHSQRLTIYASSFFQQQDKAWDIMLGGAAGVTLKKPKVDSKKDIEILLGGWYRYNSDIIPYIGLNWLGVQLGLSYDISVSAIDGLGSNSIQRALELSLIYNGGLSNSNMTPKNCSAGVLVFLTNFKQ